MRASWWWIDRWRASTAYTDMTLEQQGAYRNLLDELWLRNGAIPNDERILAKVCGDASAWVGIRDAVLAHFYLADGSWRNKTHDVVMARSAHQAEKQRRYRNTRGNVTSNVAVSLDQDLSQDQDQNKSKSVGAGSPPLHPPNAGDKRQRKPRGSRNGKYDAAFVTCKDYAFKTWAKEHGHDPAWLGLHYKAIHGAVAALKGNVDDFQDRWSAFLDAREDWVRDHDPKVFVSKLERWALEEQ